MSKPTSELRPADAARFDENFGKRQFGTINWIGLRTLYEKEVRRFMKVGTQTLLAPIVTTLLYLTVFLMAFSGPGRDAIMLSPDGTPVKIPFAIFLPPGLVMMGVITNAFQNSSSSLIIGKVQGNIVDVLMPPLSAAELTMAFIAGAATRGLLVGFVTVITIGGFMLFSDNQLSIQHWWAVILFSLCAAICLAAFGAMAGMWAEKFDQLALIANFIITPLTFLSGTFYSVKREGMPDWIGTVSDFNPLFYMIDGFRFGFIGVSDSNVVLGAFISLGLASLMSYLTFRLFKSGYKLKA